MKELKKEESKPVAWIDAISGKPKMKGWVQTAEDIPLYTHAIRKLTDEEIKLEAKYFCHTWYSQNPERLVLFARAIEKAIT